MRARTVIAFISAPLVAAAASAICLAFAADLLAPSGVEDEAVVSLCRLLLLFGAFHVLALEAAIGPPTYRWLRRTGHLNGASVTLLAMITVSVAFLLPWVLVWFPSSAAMIGIGLGVGALAGALAGGWFWVWTSPPRASTGRLTGA
jgi:hypothetical protein